MGFNIKGQWLINSSISIDTGEKAGVYWYSTSAIYRFQESLQCLQQVDPSHQSNV
jgi:hypothetical protein